MLVLQCRPHALDGQRIVWAVGEVQDFDGHEFCLAGRFAISSITGQLLDGVRRFIARSQARSLRANSPSSSLSAVIFSLTLFSFLSINPDRQSRPWSAVP